MTTAGICVVVLILQSHSNIPTWTDRIASSSYALEQCGTIYMALVEGKSAIVFNFVGKLSFRRIVILYFDLIRSHRSYRSYDITLEFSLSKLYIQYCLCNRKKPDFHWYRLNHAINMCWAYNGYMHVIGQHPIQSVRVWISDGERTYDTPRRVVTFEETICSMFYRRAHITCSQYMYVLLRFFCIKNNQL